MQFLARRTALVCRSAYLRPGVQALAYSQDGSPLQTAFNFSDDEEDVRYRTQKNPVIPNVDGLAKRWNKLDAGQQDDIIAYLEDKMRGNWNELTVPEKQALWYIYYGPWGARGTDKDTGAIYSYFGYFALLATAGVLGCKYYVDSKKQESPPN